MNGNLCFIGVVPDGIGGMKCGQTVGLHLKMEHITQTLSAGPARGTTGISGNEPLWAVLRDLRDCQVAFGISSRDIETLQAMISFLKGQSHRMVFASNRKILERMSGISVKTLQRSTARLVDAGLIVRRDSGNGKRFVRRNRGSSVAEAFGFDLSPLVDKADEIAWHAEEHRAETVRCRMLKGRLRALLSRLRTALPFHGLIDTVTAALRRKLRSSQIELLADAVEAELPCPFQDAGRQIEILEPACEDKKMTPNDSHFDAHHHKSNTDDIDKNAENEETTVDAAPDMHPVSHAPDVEDVMRACPEVMNYCPEQPRCWDDFRHHARMMAGWLGISQDLIDQAQERFGADGLALTVLCMIQSANGIRNPGAYLRSLASGPRSVSFDPHRWFRRLLLSASCTGNGHT